MYFRVNNGMKEIYLGYYEKIQSCEKWRNPLKVGGNYVKSAF